MDNLSSSDSGAEDNTTLGTHVASFTDFPEYQAAMVIWKIVPPCILLLGGFGNIATIFVMRRIKDHNSSQHAILMALAVSDLTVLYSAAAGAWIEYLFQVNLLILHVAVCKLLLWTIYTSGTTSAWLVTCVTVQRTMAVLWPHRMRVMCTVRRTWIVIATLVLTACALDFHLLLGLEITHENVCYAMPGIYQQFFDFFFSWVDLSKASVFPAVSQFVCDVILSVTLFKALSSSMAAPVDANVSEAHKTDSRRKMSYRTTVMILLLSCAFLVLVSPIRVALILFPYSHEERMRYPRAVAKWKLIYAAAHQFLYANSAINFLLYILTGTRFRREFMNWIHCGAHSPSAPSVHETASGASRGGRHKHPGNSPVSK